MGEIQYVGGTLGPIKVIKANSLTTKLLSILARYVLYLVALGAE
jgi:hypothetical protein